MPVFRVALTRSYLVEIRAKDDEDAKRLAEFFIGGEHDLSTERDRAEHDFEILEIDPVINDAPEAELVPSDSEAGIGVR